MEITIQDIFNNNKKNIVSDDIYKSFNSFIFSNDIKVIGKLLYRFKFFEKVKHLPGDIVEIGVFKGSGIASFSKFINIFCPNSNKKVLGFDIFDSDNKNEILNKDTLTDKNAMNQIYNRVDQNDLSLESVETRLNNMDLEKKHILIKGDVEDTLPKFLEENPGFRTSLIYIDVDLERPTYNAMKYLWDRLLPGGIVVFDEYEYHKFSESTGVEKFLKEKGLSYTIKTTDFMAPTAYLVKE